MKKVFFVLLGIIGFILLAAVLVPIIFKDQIKAKVEQEINNNIRAEAYFGDFGLSVFRNFPNVTASLHDFGIVGIEPFAEDTLTSIESFHIVLDLQSVLFGDQIKINRVELNKPQLKLIVLEDGTANYDIAMDTAEVEEADTTQTTFNVSVQSWKITDGHIAYYDMSSNMLTDLTGINHEGSGDFTQDVFDMVTFTSIDAFTFNMDDVDYLSDKKIEADVALNMNLPESKYTFLENKFKVNDFGFLVDGFIAMPAEAIDMDLDFKSDDNSFKSLISLVPGIYKEGFENLETSGNFQFSGTINGTYDEASEQMPGYDINLMVDNGYVKYPEYPIPVKDIVVTTNIRNESGHMKDGIVEVSKFSMNVDGKPFTANMWLKDFDNMQWRLSAKGALDLTTIMSIIDYPDMTLEGLIEADIITEGNMAAVEAEQYDQLPTSGEVIVSDFYFESVDLSQGFSITTAEASFDPQRVQLRSFNGKIGSSDMKIDGYLANYLGYAMSDTEVLQGNMSLTSNSFNVNEWMTEEEEATPEDTTELSVIEIPKNLAFVFNASLQEVLYDNLNLKNLNGRMTINNGILSMENISFSTLGGQFAMSGSYNTSDINNPLFDFNFDIQNLGFSEAFQNFNTVKVIAPIAEKINGQFNTNFKLAGGLQQNMMPKYNTLAGSGVISIINAVITDSKIISGITSLTKLKNSDQVALQDVVLEAEVDDGKIFWDPFDIKLGNVNTTVFGNNSVDGNIDFLLKMDVPAGPLGSAVNQAIAQLSGGSTESTSSNLLVNLAVGGTYNDPKIRLAETKAGESTASQAKAALKDQADAKKSELKAEAKEELTEQKEELEKQLEEEKGKVEEKVKKEAKEEVEKAKDKLNKFFKGGK
ncbi:MAG: AsmA-like C-terminal region-containing protein [Cyclobacteriaceae bacterium]